MDTKEQIINFSILNTSDYVQNFVGFRPLVKVHSVYKNTINLLINHQIFALQPKDGYLSPVSLITSLTVPEFQHLELPDYCQLNLDYQHGSIFQSSLQAIEPTESELCFRFRLAEQILKNASSSGLRLLLSQNEQDLILSASQRILHNAQQYYQANETEKAAQELAKLIGLGIGLTPSGDDFLCGLISVFQRFNQPHTRFYLQLKKEISENLSRTNPISQRFLECALENQFSQAIHAFFDNQSTDITVLKNQFEQIGHSSGMDTLFGIYYGIKLLNH